MIIRMSLKWKERLKGNINFINATDFAINFQVDNIEDFAEINNFQIEYIFMQGLIKFGDVTVGIIVSEESKDRWNQVKEYIKSKIDKESISKRELIIYSDILEKMIELE